MANVKYSRVTLEESSPDAPQPGDVAFRVLSYDDNDGLCHWYEVHCAEFNAYDDGDCESGPHLSLELGPWKCIAHGLGNCTLEEAARDVYEMHLANEGPHGRNE